MFNLEDYEPVEERLAKFIKDFPDFRLETELVAHTHDRYIVKASIYRTYADSAPYSSGLAEETVSSRGVNSTSALENCETSAIGRALANAGYATKGKRASREEMVKVNNSKPKPFAEKLAEHITVPKEDDPWTIKTVTEAPQAAMSVEQVAKTIGATILKDDPTCLHGNRIWRTGVKNGKPWGMWACDARPMNGERFADVEKCDPMWMSLASDGTWKERI
jgi:hypothetical protein